MITKKPITDKTLADKTAGKPAEMINKISQIMSEHKLSRISYKGMDEQGNDMEIILEAPLCGSTVISHMPTMQAAPVTVAQAPLAQAPTAPTAPAASVDNTATINSPMIGVIYSASKPGAEPYIKIGDRVEKGQDIFIIECMKTMNLVKSTKAGVVKEIYAQNGKPVEYDQPLVLINVE